MQTGCLKTFPFLFYNSPQVGGCWLVDRLGAGCWGTALWVLDSWVGTGRTLGLGTGGGCWMCWLGC